MKLADFVDLDMYPIDRPGSDDYVAAVAAARDGLRSVGCAVVTNLIRAAAVAELVAEIEQEKPTTHFSMQTMNPYFHTEVNDEFPERHPVNTFIERSSGFIPGDSWDPAGPMNRLFRGITFF